MGIRRHAPRVTSVSTSRAVGLFAAVLSLGAAACTGSVGDTAATPGEPGDGTAATGGKVTPSAGKGGGTAGTGGTTPVVVDPAPIGMSSESAGPLPMRRLTRRELNNTIATLLGDTSNPGDALPVDTMNETGFLSPRDVSTLEARIYYDAAESIAARAVKNLTKLLPCDHTKIPEADCAQQFVKAFGRRAYRRPLSDAEATALFNVYDATRMAGLEFTAGIQLALQAMLQSPNLIYRWEITPGAKLVADNGLVRLTPHQVASRLSFLLWAGPPDDSLLDAADGNKLATADEIKAQVKRMLADTRANGALAEFHRQWLQLQAAGGIDTLEKSTTKFPATVWNPDVRTAVKNGFDAFAASVFLDERADHTIKGLLTAPVAYVNAKSAPIYGITDVTGTDLVRRDVNATQRAGLFTQPAFLAVHATASATVPTKRGAIVWRNLLCGPLGSVPAEVPDIKETTGTSTRQRFEEHDKLECASCHRFLDPPGFAFESYDAIGQFRVKEDTVTVDPSGAFDLPSGKKVTFKNAIDLLGQLADSDEVQRCVTRQWYRYALGRDDVAADKVSIDLGFGAMKSKSGDLREVLPALVTSKTFLYRQPEQGEQP